MTARSDAPVAVIIAARNMEGRIARSVRSALDQAEVGEVIVVDDGSTDGTATAAQAADDGSSRLRVIVQPVNLGPSAARNCAIAASVAPILAILDADDFFLPNRFARLLAIPDWDVIADNIAFVRECDLPRFDPVQIADLPLATHTLTLEEFILGNISLPGKKRGELGFSKPLLRRSLLESTGLAYREELRLAEDYAFYAELMAAGGRFVRIRTCGYVSVERENSLSAVHGAMELAELQKFDQEFYGNLALSSAAREALVRHTNHIANKVHYRQLLDARKQLGRLRAMTSASKTPWRLPMLIKAVMLDKWLARQRPQTFKETRYLF